MSFFVCVFVLIYRHRSTLLNIRRLGRLFLICLTNLDTVIEIYNSISFTEMSDSTENINLSVTEECLTATPEVKQSYVCKEHLSS